MGASFRLWWQKIKTHPVATVLITVIIALVVLVILGGYLFHWDWTGFNGNNKSGKTLWDWLQLLIVPAVLAIGIFLLNQMQKSRDERIAQKREKTERYISLDNQQEAALQAYINSMSELILHENLRSKSNPGSHDGARAVARVRTLTVLPRLDSKRKGSVVQFLYELNLIDKDISIVNLSGANLRGADLWGANLKGANLAGADLIGAMLGVANLTDANLKDARIWEADLNSTILRGANLHNATLNNSTLLGADLRNTDLSEAYFGGANLVRAHLKGATGITIEELESEAKSLRGATMPDGSIQP